MMELSYEQALVRALLREQHPDLADLELRDVNGGWDNQVWRPGNELGVRLPRTERGPSLLRTEQRWLPELAQRLPLPTPTPVRTGEPSRLFNHTWTITSWVEGDPADRTPITHIEAAEVLAQFLVALHHQAPADAPSNPMRGIPLAGLKNSVDDSFHLIADHTHVDAARAAWQEAVDAPVRQDTPRWLHGDLHPANVIVRDGQLAGVIDFGEMCAGDPATDLSAAWILLSAGATQRFFDAYDRADEATVKRARGWAVVRALGLIAIGQSGRLGLPGGKPTWEPAGYATLERVVAAN